MDRGALRQRIIDWLDDQYHFGEAEQKIGDDDASFLDRGVLDSLGFVALIVWLEDLLHLAIDRRNISRENFDSMNKILDYVERRLAGERS
ncbi:MAG TPA: acyl carrier protein [Myxococcota bacterium]|nr:acyl carrier protein [Myxococcota bacterium]HQK50252.1 acyl carrier protein [Myxococcota bacterium]